MRRLLAKLFDPEIDLQERSYRLVSYIASVFLIIMALVAVFLGESMSSVLILLAAAVLYGLLFLLTVRFRRYQLGSCIIVASMTLIVLPACFFSTGGIYSSTAMWYIFLTVFIASMVKSKLRPILYFVTIGSFATCLIISLTHPELVTPQSEKAFYIDTFVAVVLVSLLTCGLMLFQIRTYREQRILSESRQKEVENLNESQARFFSNMSHEIRTPINSIIGLNELILRNTDDEEIRKDALQIQGSSRMLLSLINDILDMSKMESGKMEIVNSPYSLGEMISELTNMIRPRATEKELDYTVEVGDNVPSKLLGDDVRIKQILINLLNNAVKYTNEGCITFSVQCEQDEDDRVFIVFSVSDTGIGIKRESIANLFDVFQRLELASNRYIEGTGLGLSIVKQLVTLMNGEVNVNSVYTKGSTFVVRLPQPVVDSTPLKPESFKDTNPKLIGERHKSSFTAPDAQILIVDDNELNLIVEAKLIQPIVPRVDTAASGEECLEKTLETHYDLILMDHMMPGMDGIECLAQIRSQAGGLNRDTAVIALTANADPKFKSFYTSNGFDSYLIKPVNGKILEDLLLDMLPNSLIHMRDSTIIKSDAQSQVRIGAHKAQLQITTENLCDLPRYLLDQYHINTIPSKIITDHGVFYDDYEVDTAEIINYMEQPGVTVKTGPSDVADYERFFAEQLEHANQVLHITVSNEKVSLFQNPVEAAQSFGNVTVFSAHKLSAALGMLTCEAARMAVSGNYSIDEIIEHLTEYNRRVRFSFLLGSTGNLLQAGFISRGMHRFAETMMLHPVVSIGKGGLRIRRIYWGYMDSCIKKYIHSIFRKTSMIDKERVIVVYCTLSEERKARIETMIRELIDVEELIFQRTSPSSSVNTGAETIGIAYRLIDSKGD